VMMVMLRNEQVSKMKATERDKVMKSVLGLDVIL
jgi:hypothetical protein